MAKPRMSSMMGPEYSVVVPCYNSDESLEQLVERIDRVFEEEVRASYEILLVDDCSPRPETWRRIRHLALDRRNVRGLRLMRNFGKPGAEMCGYWHARGCWIIGMDDDLQHLPEEIPKLIALRQHDVVMGRFKKRHHGLFARLSSRVKGQFDRWSIGKPKDVYVSPFRLLKREVVKEIVKIRTPYPFIPALLFHVTRDVVCADVEHAARPYGRSTYTLLRKIRQFSNLLINNSSFLLRLTALLGFGSAIAGGAYAGWLVFRRLTVAAVAPGWTSIMVVLLLVGGMILVGIGVVGEYLIRIINGIEDRPAYVVREEVGEQEAGELEEAAKSV